MLIDFKRDPPERANILKPTIFWWAIAVWSTVVALCLGVCWSALRTYHTLKQLQSDSLRNQAANIAASVEFASRGLPATSLSEFQRRVEEIYSGSGSGLAELAVVNRDRMILAHSDVSKVGRIFEEAGLDELFQSRRIYEERYEIRSNEPIYELFLPAHTGLLGAREGASTKEGPTFNVVAISLFISSVSFISRQGKINLFLTLSACAFLLSITSYYFVALRRSFQLEVTQAKEQQWVSLGRMSATLAHDIRNPLGAIKGLAQMLRERMAIEDETSSYIQTIVREAERLEKLVADLLLFARPRPPEPRTFLFRELLQDVTALFESSFQSKRIDLRIEEQTPGLTLATDYDLLKRVLINLIENSFLAMPEGGHLRVLGSWDSNARKNVIQIDDDGQGLPVDAEKAFEPFYTTRASGTGLGLAICGQIVESLGGTVSLTNGPVRGTSCTILLPRQA